MKLPVFRPAYLTQWTNLDNIRRGLKRDLLGKTIAIPPQWSRAENAALLDSLTALLSLPVCFPELLPGEREDDDDKIKLYTDSGQAPQAKSNEIALWNPKRDGSRDSLMFPPEATLVRNALLQAFGQTFRSGPLRSVSSWCFTATDSPGTLISFIDGAMRLSLQNPNATDPELYTAGLVGSLVWMLEATEDQVVQWVVALLTLNSTPQERQDVLVQAFDQGLMISLPEKTWRQPIQAMRLKDAPQGTTPEMILASIHAAMPRKTFVATIESLLPRSSLEYLEELPYIPNRWNKDLERLKHALISDGSIPIVAVSLDGPYLQKLIAQRVTYGLSQRFEAVMVDVSGGFDDGWRLVAQQSKLPISSGSDWKSTLIREVSQRALLIIFWGVGGLLTRELARNIPSGEGRCAVLLLGASPRQISFTPSVTQGPSFGPYPNIDWSSTNLREADLRGADFDSANLEKANLGKANLASADLRHAILRHANLGEANLAKAILLEAGLQGANFERANLEGAILEGAFYNAATRWPDGFDPERAGAIRV